MKRSKRVPLKIVCIILLLILGMNLLHRERATEFEFEDRVTKINDLNALEPKTRKLAETFLTRCYEEGLPVVITETYRSQARQDELYEQGRSRSGPIVTWTHHSMHTERRAFDICKDGPDPYGDEAFFKRCADIGLEVGLTPGYYFEKYQDKPHFQRNEWWD